MTKLTRKQKAIVENILMRVRLEVSREWNLNEYSHTKVLAASFDRVRASLWLRDIPRDATAYGFEGYVRIIEKILVDEIRVARTYHDMIAEQILVSLDVAEKALTIT